MKRTTVYLRILEIGANDPGKPYTLEGIVDDLKKEFPKYDFDNDSYIAYWFYSHFWQNQFVQDAHYFMGNRYSAIINKKFLQTDSFFLKEAFFSNIEYVELNEARDSSLKAQKNAKTAIIISIIALSLSLVFSFFEILISAFQIIIDFLK